MAKDGRVEGTFVPKQMRRHQGSLPAECRDPNQDPATERDRR